MIASLMVHEWATPLNMSAPVAGLLTAAGYICYWRIAIRR
tara:strand:+ start:409 stop:528 length:120 start_codon:yes stop_codon:yes gene_type:complete